MTSTPQSTGTFNSPGGRKAHWHFVDRHGGSSNPPFDSLNVGLQVGDDPQQVIANRARLRDRHHLRSLFFLRQTHGTAIHIAREYEADLSCDLEPSGGCDAAITDRSGLGLAIQTADCQAVLFFDPVRSVIAAAHAGWRGSVAGILPLTVAQMQTEFHCSPADLQVRISPALGPCCAEFVHWRQELPPEFAAFQLTKNHFDFPAISTMQLVKVGVKEENITASTICTSCSRAHFSWRRTVRQGEQSTGRNCSIVYMEDL